MVERNETVEVLSETPFLKGSDKWAGRVQVLRVTVQTPPGPPRIFINKRLIFTNSGRFINLPRAGCDEILDAIEEASEIEREHHKALLTEMNRERGSSHPQSQGHRNDAPVHRFDPSTRR